MYTKKLKCARCGATNEIIYLEKNEAPPHGKVRGEATCEVCQSAALFDFDKIAKAS
jgi:hypothetical protein